MKHLKNLRLFVPLALLLFLGLRSFSFDLNRANEKRLSDTTTLTDLYEYIFAQLNRGDVPTGFLAERGFPLISMEPFNGILTDSNKVTIDTWRALYFGFWWSRLDQTTNPFYGIGTVNSIMASQHDPESSTIPVAVLFGEYNAFHPDALTNNLLSVSNKQFYDVPARPASPYVDKYLFAAAPMRSEVKDENFSLVFKASMFHTNTGQTINGLFVDFDDGQGNQTVSFDTPVYPAYTSAGVKNIKIQLGMTNSNVYTCYAPVDVKSYVGSSRFSGAGPNVTIPISATSNHSGGRLMVRYASSNTSGHILKPFIVLEGFDPFAIAPTLAKKNNSYEDFIEEMGVISSYYDLNYQLDDVANYDLVFLDYANGTDDIVRNAALLEDALGIINTDKAAGSSSQQNVILGISMGGLVSRYALAKMTKNSVNPQTRLLITQDSPHQGANVPLGLQMVARALGRVDAFGQKLADIFPLYAEASALLNEPATAQLLKYRVSDNYGTIATNTWLPGAYRSMITFSPSDPQPAYQFAAVSLGAECGTALFSPGSALLNVEATGGGLAPLILGTAKMSAEIKANALPSPGGSIQLAKVKYSVKVKFLGFITVKRDFYEFTSSVNNSPYLAIDGAPGGTSPLGEFTAPDASLKGNMGFGLVLGYAASISSATLSNFTFVPTVSALDVMNEDNASLTSVYKNGWSPLNPSRASTFITHVTETLASEANERHPRFTARNAEWIYKLAENVSGNTGNCTSNCTIPTPTIAGSSYFCDPEAYTVNNLPPGASVSWSASPSGIVSISTSGNTATLTKVSNGFVTLTATITYACGTASSDKYIGSGSPSYPYGQMMVSGDTNPLASAIYQYDMPSYPNAVVTPPKNRTV